MASPYRNYGKHLTAQHTHLATPPPPQHIPLPPSRATTAMSGRSASYTPHPQTPPHRSGSGSYAYQPSPLGGDARSPARGTRSAMGAYESLARQPSPPSLSSAYSEAATASTYGQPRYHEYPAAPVPPLNIHHRNSPPMPSAGPPLLAPTPKYPRTSPRAPSLLSRFEEPLSTYSESEPEREEVRSHTSHSTRATRRPRASSPTPTSRTAVSHRSAATAKTAGTASTVKRVQSQPSLVSGRVWFMPDSNAPPVPTMPVMTPLSNYSAPSSGYGTPVSVYSTPYSGYGTPASVYGAASSATSVMSSAPSYAATPNQFAHPPFPGYVPPAVPQAHPAPHPGSGISPRKRTITSTATFVDDGRGHVTKVSEYINYDPKKSLFKKLFK